MPRKIFGEKSFQKKSDRDQFVKNNILTLPTVRGRSSSFTFKNKEGLKKNTFACLRIPQCVVHNLQVLLAFIHTPRIM